jgi:HTH-type transcriptional regulator/antitoxin HigA
MTANTEILKVANEVRELLPVPIESEDDYDRAVECLEAVIEEIGDNENHPLIVIVDLLSLHIERWDEEHHSIPDADGTEMVKYFMGAFGLRQQDLPEIGNQSVVSQILSGERILNVRQISRLAERFNVSRETFFPKFEQHQ